MISQQTPVNHSPDETISVLLLIKLSLERIHKKVRLARAAMVTAATINVVGNAPARNRYRATEVVKTPGSESKIIFAGMLRTPNSSREKKAKAVRVAWDPHITQPTICQ